jgi:RNA-splicing ligase RtcB
MQASELVSTIKTFGDVDARSLAHLERCMDAGDAVQTRLRAQGIVVLGGGADEAPEVYKRLPDVLAAHAGSIRVKHTLRPLGVAMAGRDVHDPYKD